MFFNLFDEDNLCLSSDMQSESVKILKNYTLEQLCEDL